MFKESICQRHKMLNPKISAGEYHEAAIQIKRPKKKEVLKCVIDILHTTYTNSILYLSSILSKVKRK